MKLTPKVKGVWEFFCKEEFIQNNKHNSGDRSIPHSLLMRVARSLRTRDRRCCGSVSVGRCGGF